jgi:two-component system chemotaxis response regulator CheB
MRFKIVVVGASLGGLHALEAILSALPEDFPLPVAVVQHRSVLSGEAWVHVLQRHSRLKVREPLDKDPIQPGRVYIAPPDYHLLVDDGAFALSTDEPVLFARPSIDVLFESVADAFGSGTIGVVLTGASEDGARGAARIKRRGGYLVVQDPETAESPVMPRAALAAQPDQVLPLGEIGAFLDRFCRETE